jgi:hypothetical protein
MSIGADVVAHNSDGNTERDAQNTSGQFLIETPIRGVHIKRGTYVKLESIQRNPAVFISKRNNA